MVSLLFEELNVQVLSAHGTQRKSNTADTDQETIRVSIACPFGEEDVVNGRSHGILYY